MCKPSYFRFMHTSLMFEQRKKNINKKRKKSVWVHLRVFLYTQANQTASFFLWRLFVQSSVTHITDGYFREIECSLSISARPYVQKYSFLSKSVFCEGEQGPIEIAHFLIVKMSILDHVIV